MRFVILLKGHNKPWNRRRIRSVNLQLDKPLIGCGVPHINDIDTTSFLREQCTIHGLHVNYSSKKSLTHLFAKRFSGNLVPSVSSISVTIHARESNFLAENT